MKQFLLVLTGLAILATTTTACQNKDNRSEGRDITPTFLSQYTGTFAEDAFGESLQIQRNGAIKRRYIRQVGTDGGDIPYPTLCTYFMEGQITKVYERSQERRNSYMPYATHLIEITFSSTKLDTSEGAKQETLENCRKLEGRGGSYSHYAELLDENTIRVHTSGGGDSSGGSVRTASTFDEIFTRVGTPVSRTEFTEMMNQKFEFATLECGLTAYHWNGQQTVESEPARIVVDLLRETAKRKELRLNATAGDESVQSVVVIEAAEFVAELTDYDKHHKAPNDLRHTPRVRLSFEEAQTIKGETVTARLNKGTLPVYENSPVKLWKRAEVDGFASDFTLRNLTSSLACELKTRTKPDWVNPAPR